MIGHGGPGRNDRCGEIQSIFTSMLEEASIRGRDSAGVSIRGREVESFKTTGDVSDIIEKIKLHGHMTSAIANLRAEPTTEYVENKELTDVQPYSSNETHMVHNGTIANDKELKEEYGIDLPTIIDSAIIPIVLDRENGDVSKLKGSMALAWWDEKHCDLYLYKNYQPISVFYVNKLRTYFFCSYRSTFLNALKLNGYNTDKLPMYQFREIDFPPYSKMTFRRLGHSITRDIRPDVDKAIVIISGGLDSTTSAKVACLNHKEITLCHFEYGCRAQDREIQAVNDIAEALRSDHPEHKITVEILDLSFLKKLGGSTLIDGEDGDIGKGEQGAEFALDWVPFRNGTMIALAAAYCDRHKIGNIYLGLNLEESGAYPDNTTEFYQTFNKVLDVGSQSRPIIKNPLGDLMKHEIVNLALHIKAPIDKSWSCYRGDEKPCGKCGPCYLRSKAFLMNKLIDCVDYQEAPLDWGDSKECMIGEDSELSDRLKDIMTEWIEVAR